MARFLAGVVGGGAYALVPVYISEIADDKCVFHFDGVCSSPNNEFIIQ